MFSGMGEHDSWKLCDTEAILKRRDEQTTSANIATVPVPLGPPLRAPSLAGPSRGSFPGGIAGAQDQYAIPSEYTRVYKDHRKRRR